jgi:hypothetical protein
MGVVLRVFESVDVVFPIFFRGLVSAFLVLRHCNRETRKGGRENVNVKKFHYLKYAFKRRYSIML